LQEYGVCHQILGSFINREISQMRFLSNSVKGPVRLAAPIFCAFQSLLFFPSAKRDKSKLVREKSKQGMRKKQDQITEQE
jgi:hypothetical protein